MLNRQLLITLCLTASIVGSCELPNDAVLSAPTYTELPSFTVQWNDQNTLICFGTSLTYGYGAGAKTFFGPAGPGGNTVNIHIGDSSYPRFLQEKLKITVLNKGYVGARLSYALSILQDSILSRKPSLILLEYGANDFLWDIPSKISDSLLSELITRIQLSGTKIVLLSFVHPDMLQFAPTEGWTPQDSQLALEYYSMITSIAQRFNVPLIDYPMNGVFGHPELMSDRLHPNGTGYFIMEENIYYSLHKTFEKNGMAR